MFPGLRFRVPEWDPKDYYSEHFRYIRKIVWDRLWFLIPWVWSQTWSEEENIKAIEATMKASYVWPWSIAINSSSWISEAHKKETNKWLTFAQAVEREINFLTSNMKRVMLEIDKTLNKTQQILGSN